MPLKQAKPNATVKLPVQKATPCQAKEVKKDTEPSRDNFGPVNIRPLKFLFEDDLLQLLRV